MRSSLLLLLGLIPAALAAKGKKAKDIPKVEETLAVFILHSSGDRTPLVNAPANLTALGAAQMYQSGQFYHNRYIAADAPVPISGVSNQFAVPEQLDIISPNEPVLHSSAVAFLQGLYPPTHLASTLANGTTVEAPCGGYQYVPVYEQHRPCIANRAARNTWMQSKKGCLAADQSKERYLNSWEHKARKKETKPFYNELLPALEGTMKPADVSYENAHEVYDYLRYSQIHNTSFPLHKIDGERMHRLRALASEREWDMVHDVSDPIRAIEGSKIAGTIFDTFITIFDSEPRIYETKEAPPLLRPFPKMSVHFADPSTFMSFSLGTDLQFQSPDWRGLADFASSMVLELVIIKPEEKEVPDKANFFVRLFFSNGTAGEHMLEEYSMYGLNEMPLTWDNFKGGLKDFMIMDDSHYCWICGSGPDRPCPMTKGGEGGDGNGDAHVVSCISGSGVGEPVAGVIGALVALGLGALGTVALFFGGFRVVKRTVLLARQKAPEEQAQ